MIRVDQFADLDHCCGGVDTSEEFPVGCSEFFPAADVGYEHPSSDDVLESCSDFFERGFDLV
jgi:hypothetical protein